MHPADTDVALLDIKGIPLFAKRFASWLWRTGLNRYADERWDCDDYADAAFAFAKIDHALWQKVDASVGLGMVWYWGEEGLHAVNWTAHQLGADEKITIKLWEPQITWNSSGTVLGAFSEVPVSSVSRWLFCRW